MKGYKFKLDPVLKIRKLKEDRCKMDIGRLQVQITELKRQLQEHSKGIDEAYKSQEVGLKDGMSGQSIQFYPYFISGKTAHIDFINNEIGRLNEQVQEKFNQLKQLRANVKVVEKMKEKDKTKYRKNLEKKQFEEIEENVQNWKQSLKEG